MKTIRLLFIGVLLYCCPQASGAGPDWVGQFLSRYRATPNPLQFRGPQQPSASFLVDGSVPISVNELLRLMLESNLNISVDRLPPQISQFLIETYYRPFDPTIHVTANDQRSTTVSTSQLNGATSLSQLTQSYDVGLGQTLMTGTSYGVDLILNRNSNNNTFAVYNPSWVGQIRYSVSQHLLQNRGRLPAEHLIRVARNNQKVSSSLFDQQLMDIVTQAQNAYWDYVFSLEDMKVKQQSRNLAQKTLDDVKSEVEVGTRAPLDVVQAEAQLAVMDDALVVSTFTSHQDEDLLKKIVSNNIDPGRLLARLAPVDALRSPLANDTVPIAQAIQIALENRPELKQSQLALKNTEIDSAFTANQILPALDINATYAQNGLGGVQRLRSALGGNTIVGIIPGGIGDAFGQLFGFSYNTYSAGINLQIPLSNKAARADHDRAVGSRQMAGSQVDAVAQQIALEVRNAMNQVDMNRAHIESAKKARDFAQQTLDAEQQKYELGVSTLFFVLQDQTNLAVAQTNEIQAMVNYTKALVSYDRATGQSLSHNNIVVENTGPRIVNGTAN